MHKIIEWAYFGPHSWENYNVKLLLPMRTLLTLCKVNKYYAFGVKKTK